MKIGWDDILFGFTFVALVIELQFEQSGFSEVDAQIIERVNAPSE